ncbi:hypothetical protein A7E75_04610 [Syntrophotalea acetylenica]|jgi:hypothetical protein|uniref:Uncharacterized protein n=1 Tax=Syntrophotalea acetylenica TaxID=29542 RepID=A0A1L3GEL2_SYNAC|nr:hypothetical protein A7E75_04610 [Syntrophotalea acetylenica]APG44978.1 hypothetical protein A6070_13255 [Syntrophotalea acetylenica]
MGRIYRLSPSPRSPEPRGLLQILEKLQKGWDDFPYLYMDAAHDIHAVAPNIGNLVPFMLPGKLFF